MGSANYRKRKKMNLKNKHVSVLYGGLSFEREVSLSSGKAVFNALKQLGYNKASLIDFNKESLSHIANNKPDIVFNALHGTFGEDGCLQGFLEILQIPYTHSGVLSSALAMNKQSSKTILQNKNILFPSGYALSIDDYSKDMILKNIPCVLKPISQGSSVGVFIINDESQIPTKEDLIAISNEFMVEEYINGKELSVAVTDDEPLGVMELIPKDGFFDYKSKYTKGMTSHVVPAKIDKNIYDEAMKIAFKAHKALGCRGITRSDFRYDDVITNKLYLLELNTHPGMTNISIAPDIAKYKGIGFNDLVEYLVKSATLDNKVS